MTETGLTVSVIGCGYLGAVHAVAMAELGHTVVGVDVDPERVAGLGKGEAPFYEPGLDEMLRTHLDTGRLRFADDIREAADAVVHFLCVGTPQTPGENAADLQFVEAALTALLGVVKPGDVIVGKSTVPVGTAARLADRLHESVPGASLVWNPEFLREGVAIQDTLQPDRVVIGVGSRPADAQGRDLLITTYAGLLDGTPLIVTSYPTAELVKVAANSFLATKISFINAMAELCELAGADVTELADAIGHDARIGRKFLNAGVGFGGGCLPKDIRAFMARAGELGAADTLSFLREVDLINLRQREKTVTLVRDWLGGDLDGRRIAVLGAAFKPNSDDIRDSPALVVAEALHQGGASVTVTDPRALDNARRRSPQLSFADSALEAAAGAEVVLLLTEWADYVDLDPEALGEVVAARRILDGRNALAPDTWTSLGWDYRALGRRAGS